MLERAHDLKAREEPFALATVVRVERPASARPGMKAIVRADGALEGWVGGSCAHPIVVREALNALREGAPRLIRLSPDRDPRALQEGMIYHPITCHSGGSLEIYIEPFLRKPQLLLVGEAPLVGALARLGRSAGFAVWVPDADEEVGGVVPDLRVPLGELQAKITPDTYAVVATMGTSDEDALERIAGTGAAYVGLVASRKRAQAVFADLTTRGLAVEDLQRIKVPAGLDIGAVTPEEIALSIMAEIIQVRRSRFPTIVETREQDAVVSRGVATDPICGMAVEIVTAKHTVEHQGVRFYFCSAHCQREFERDPARYVTAGV